MKRWQNSDLHNLGTGLLNPDANDAAYLAQVLNTLQLMLGNGSAANRKIETFNITDVTAFTTALSEWYTTHPTAIIVGAEYIEDATGTKIYMITYL